MSLIRRAVAQSLERRDFPGSDPFSIPAPGQLSGILSSAGTEVTDTSALSLTTFFAGVRIITDSITFLPLRATVQVADGTRAPVVPTPMQLTDPFSGCSLQEGISQIITSLILRGNAYIIEVAWDGAGDPSQWRILNPDQVIVTWDKRGERVYTINGVVWDSAWMNHVANFMLPNGLKGSGVVEYCRNALGLGVALDEVAGTFFKNGVMASGVISVDQPLSPDEARAAALQFQQNHSGTKRAHLPVIMGGGAKFQQMSLSPDDAQFLQSRQFSDGQIATLLGIPPHLLGIMDRTTSWGTGIEVQGRGFVDYTLRPYIQRLQTLFSSWLPDGTSAELMTDALTRADTATRFSNYHWMLTDGWANKDYVRMLEGLPPLPDGAGQVYTTPVTQAPSSNGAGIIAAAPAAPIPPDNPVTGDA